MQLAAVEQHDVGTQCPTVFAAVNVRDTLTHTFHNTEQGVAPLSVQEPGMLTYLGIVLYFVSLFLNQVRWGTCNIYVI